MTESEKEEMERLKAQVSELQAEKENWLTEKVYTVQKIRREEPPDYRENKRKVRELEKRNRTLEKVMRYGRISCLNDTISEYQAMSKVYLIKIAAEMEYCPAGVDERHGLLGLLDYLSFVSKELESMLIVGAGEGDEKYATGAGAH